MKTTVVNEQDLPVFLYGVESSSNLDYLRERHNDFMSRMVGTNPYAEVYNNQSRNYDLRYINSVKERLGGDMSYQDDGNIYHYNDPREANITNIEYIMANRKLSRLYERGLINGYSGTSYRHDKYQSRLRYQEVMNGRLSETKPDTFVEYFDSDMRELNHYDSDIVYSNWKRAIAMFNEDIDPTDR